MARGPKPTPTKLLMLRGSRRAQRRPAEATAPPASLDAPAWLSPRAQAHWQLTAPQLRASGLLTILDVPAWAMACNAWALARDLADLVANDGLVLVSEKTDKGTLHPAIRAAVPWSELYLKIAGHFGQTPASRVNLPVAVEAVDPLEQFLKGGKRKRPTRTEG